MGHQQTFRSELEGIAEGSCMVTDAYSKGPSSFALLLGRVCDLALGAARSSVHWEQSLGAHPPSAWSRAVLVLPYLLDQLEDRHFTFWQSHQKA